jgi:sRNA-binding protein
MSKSNRQIAEFEDMAAIMRQRYPAVFPDEGAVPLKVGIFGGMDDLVREFGETRLKRFLGAWTAQTRYLEALTSGAARYDLDGAFADIVDGELVAGVKAELERREKMRPVTKVRALKKRIRYSAKVKRHQPKAGKAVSSPRQDGSAGA